MCDPARVFVENIHYIFSRRTRLRCPPEGFSPSLPLEGYSHD